MMDVAKNIVVALFGGLRCASRMARLAACLLAMMLATRAYAASNCTLSMTSLNFGTYTGALLTGVNQGTVNCVAGESYYISMNAGAGAGATTTTRLMTSAAGATLSYQIFQNSTRTVNWGNTQGVDEVTGTGTGGNQIYYAYSQVLAGQYVAPGTYTDTMTTATTSFPVTAVVQATCTISATALSMGNYSGAVVQANSSITVTCTNTTAFNVGLSAGTSTGATVTTRAMTGPGAAHLKYSLFRDAGHTQNWGVTVGTDTLASTGTGVAQSFTVYGQIPANQYVAPGNYTDTIIATVTY